MEISSLKRQHNCGRSHGLQLVTYIINYFLTYCYIPTLQIVTKISEQLNDDTKEYIRTEEAESNKENIKLWGDHIQCHFIPYKPAKKPLPKLTTKPATASAFVTDFSMKYDSSAMASVGPSKVPAAAPESKVCMIYVLLYDK